MKMKSKFFGFNAKTALAILAISGSMFTSCYEKEKDDVVLPPLPFVPAEPVYSITGSFMDANSGKPVVVDASRVSITGGFNLTVSGTSYSATLISDNFAGGNVTVTVSTVAGNSHNGATATVNVTKLQRGQSGTYMANLALVPTTLDHYTIQIASTSQGEERSTKIFTTEDGIDLSNSSASYREVSREIVLDKGALITYGTTAGELKTFADNYVNALYPAGDRVTALPLGTRNHNYRMLLAPGYGVETITVVTKYATTVYTFTYGPTTYSTTVKAVSGYEFGFSVVPLAVYHGKTHGGSLNSGGGIGDAI